jgi:single-strand DNA-binding protein
MNLAVLMGRITKDLELKNTQSGVSVLSFTIAVDRKFKDQNGAKVTDYHNIVAWRNTAEFIAKYFGKGRMICVVGELQNRQYEVDGQKRTVTELVASDAYFTGEKREENQDNASEVIGGFIPVSADDSDLPF